MAKKRSCFFRACLLTIDLPLTPSETSYVLPVLLPNQPLVLQPRRYRLQSGRVVRSSAVRSILQSRVLARCFRTRCSIWEHSDTSALLLITVDPAWAIYEYLSDTPFPI